MHARTYLPLFNNRELRCHTEMIIYVLVVLVACFSTSLNERSRCSTTGLQTHSKLAGFETLSTSGVKLASHCCVRVYNANVMEVFVILNI
jgi:hypothetical protein